MRPLPTKQYSGKVLLFGEYTVIDGSAAIAIPYDRFSGTWVIDKSDPNKESLTHLKRYVSQLYYDQKIENVDFDTFERELTKGISFQSSIPNGYGLGSSGALTAAFFDRYVRNEKGLTLSELKNILALIESAFHGRSSGLDPLVSFLNTPLLIHPDGDIELLEVDRSDFLSSLRLLDTKMPRHTAPLVEAYKQTKIKSKDFDNATKTLAELSDGLVTSYILADRTDYNKYFKSLSEHQLEVLPMLIPEKVMEIWKMGLDQNAFYMKLCGAGGGGCFLLTIVDKGKTTEILTGEEIWSIK